MNNDGLLYVGVDVHEKESQLAVLKEGGSLVLEGRIPTKDLKKFVSSLPGEKRVATKSVGFIHMGLFARSSWCVRFFSRRNQPSFRR